MGCFSGDFQEENGALRHSEKRPIKVEKGPIEGGKRPISANGPFSGTPPWWKTALLKRPIKRSISDKELTRSEGFFFFWGGGGVVVLG